MYKFHRYNFAIGQKVGIIYNTDFIIAVFA